MSLALVARRVLLAHTHWISVPRQSELAQKFGLHSAIGFLIGSNVNQLENCSLKMKPPNILVLGADSAKWKDRLERIINTELYLVYTTSVKELQSPVWIENCRLLWLSKIYPDGWPDILKANIQNYLKRFGAVVVSDSALLQAHLLEKAVLIEGNDDASLRASIEGLGVSCGRINETISGSEGYLVTDKSVNSFFKGKLPEQEFRISSEAPVSEEFMPIRLTRPNSSKFNTEEYFQFLQTRELGRTLIYTENVSSTMVTIRTIDSVHGSVAIATRQTRAVARGRNSWISPRGCAMYSVVLHFTRADAIAKRMSFLQHLAALSVVRAIQSCYPTLAVAIKWPNDVYFKRETKIAGILSTCTVKDTSELMCYLGCGVNISNSKPLTCINDLAQSRELTVERFIAVKLTQLERLLDLYEKDPAKVLEEYHANWLHTDEEVIVESLNSSAIVRRVDEEGFLLAEKPDGEMLHLQPDGNSFDLMKGLITVKQKQKSR
ncbi:biotin--protein ligase-like [Tropilaelaps mercedesae]|uniref:Biotin--protein ligase-like n=1 Tax=Tropilaelaps mercedesae TaxID=418985 RepID=A0A1V9XRK3_9ACAR|nr:biotin--protein ligase-like [Tropilaelaps mercedesae]